MIFEQGLGNCQFAVSDDAPHGGWHMRKFLMIALTVGIQTFVLMSEAQFRTSEDGALVQDSHEAEYKLGVIKQTFSRAIECQIQSGYGNTDLYFTHIPLNKLDEISTHDKSINAELLSKALGALESKITDTVRAPNARSIDSDEYSETLAKYLLVFQPESWSKEAACENLQSDLLQLTRLLEPSLGDLYQVDIETRFGGQKLLALIDLQTKTAMFFGFSWAE